MSDLKSLEEFIFEASSNEKKSNCSFRYDLLRLCVELLPQLHNVGQKHPAIDFDDLNTQYQGGCVDIQFIDFPCTLQLRQLRHNSDRGEIPSYISLPELRQLFVFDMYGYKMLI